MKWQAMSQRARHSGPPDERPFFGTKPTSLGNAGASASRGRSQPVDATLYLKGEMECALMGHRFHRGFSAAEKTELWDRWKRGESLKAIGRAFGKPSSSIYWCAVRRKRGRRDSRFTIVW